jgi:DNA repair photolyase
LSPYAIPNRVKFLLDSWPETGDNKVILSKANNLIYQLYDIYQREKILFRRYLEQYHPEINSRALTRNEKKSLFKNFMRKEKQNEQARSMVPSSA